MRDSVLSDSIDRAIVRPFRGDLRKAANEIVGDKPVSSQ